MCAATRRKSLSVPVHSRAEDRADLAAFDERKDEPVVAFKDVLKKLRRDRRRRGRNPAGT